MGMRRKRRHVSFSDGVSVEVMATSLRTANNKAIVVANDQAATKAREEGTGKGGKTYHLNDIISARHSPMSGGMIHRRW